MPRKKLPPNQLKNRRVNFWLTNDEYLNLQQQAEASGIHLNDWLRKYIFSRQFPAVKMSSINRETILELNKIGVNLNQLTRVANASKEFPTDLVSQILAVEKKVQELKNLILHHDSETN